MVHGMAKKVADITSARKKFPTDKKKCPTLIC